MEDKAAIVTIPQIVKMLSDNNREEQTAISGYLSLLERIASGGITASHQFKEVVTTVTKIISEEMSHTKKLNDLIITLSGIQPALD